MKLLILNCLIKLSLSKSFILVVYIIIYFFLKNKKPRLSYFCFGHFPENGDLVLVKY